MQVSCQILVLIGRLELEFGSKTLEAPVEKEAPPKAPSLPVDTPTIERSEDPPNQEELKAVKEVEMILRDTALQNLQLENPLLYEQLVSQGELENESAEENGFGETQ